MNPARPGTPFHRAFSHRHVVLPVIHVSSEGQALRNADIAREAGADGIFLINHATHAEALLEIHARVTAHFPGWWVGVNCLGLDPASVFARLSPQVLGVWTDNAEIEEGRAYQPRAEAIRRAREASGWPGLYFGGVAFKYQRHVDDLKRAAQTATHFMDFVTTSGPGTGEAADVDKIRTMKEAVGNFPLAIASGITPDNVLEYLPYSDCYLIATGISKSFEELDPARVKLLVETVRAWDAQAHRQ